MNDEIVLDLNECQNFDRLMLNVWSYLRRTEGRGLDDDRLHRARARTYQAIRDARVGLLRYMNKTLPLSQPQEA